MRGLPRSVFLLAAAYAALQLLTGGTYGVFRDELYYLACADHLDWGYVDHPPLSIVLLWAQRALLGDSLHALRVLPALAGVLLILLTARMAQELGGGRFAAILAAVSAAIAPQYLAITGFYSMNAFDLVFWATAALMLAGIIKTDDARRWLFFGVVVGLGLLNKISLLFFGLGLAVALVMTPLRRHLLRPHFWLGGLLAGLVFAPHVLWQVRNDWPTLEFMRNAQQYKIAALTPLQFLGAQILEINPLNTPIWLIGLGWLLFGREASRFRALGIIYVVACAVLILQKSKPYYLGPAYPMLLAAGAVPIAAFLEARRGSWARPALVGTLALGGLILAPFAIPILPVEAFLRYQRTLGVKPTVAEVHTLGPLPQLFADRFGWPEMAAAVAAVYQALPPSDQREAMIVTSNYGEAGALLYYGRRYGLPPAVSQHNSFYLWGPGPGTGKVVILVGSPEDDVRDEFENVTVAGRFESPYAMPYETRHPILVCRGLKPPLAEAWRGGRHYI